MKKTLTGVCLAMALGAVAGTGKLDYFEPKALANADMSGVKEGIERQLGRCAAEFAAAEGLAAKRSGRDRAMILDRVEIGRRLERYVRERHLDGAKDLELMAWQGAEELRNLWCYFAAEKRREEARATAPAPIVLNLRDFGAKGDGKTDDGAAFRRAFAAAKERGGKPVVLKVPKGVYLVEPGRDAPDTVAFRSYRDYDERGLPTSGVRERPWKDFGSGFHLTCHGFANFTIQGEAGTEVRFTDSAHGGFGFFGCTETILKDLAISYRDNPSTQGVIESVDEKDVGFVFKRDPGYPDPDEPRFMKAHSRRFTVHEPNGLVGYDGTGRMGTVERLSADRFLFRPYAHMKGNYYWNQRKAGERVVVIARYSENAKAFPAYWSLCSFSGAEGVQVYDSPGQNFIMFSTFAMRLLDCGALVRHGSDDLLSANADGMMGSGPIGPYVDGCRFLHMEDDGFNITTAGGVVNSVSEDRMTFLSGFDGPSAFQVDGVTGRIKSFLRRGTAWNRVKQPFVAETLSQAELDGGTLKAHDMSAWLVSNSWDGVKGERKADRTIQIPGTFGGVIRNTTLHDLRGMGVQVHCANMLLDNVTVDRTSGPGMKIAPLFGWGMMFDVHNILVRNCTFRDCADALSVVPGSVQPGVEVRQKMIQAIHLENNRFEPREGHKALIAANAAEVRVDGAKFRLYVKRDPAGKTGAATVDSDYADRVSMEVKADGTEEVTYWFDGPGRDVSYPTRLASGANGPGRDAPDTTRLASGANGAGRDAPSTRVSLNVRDFGAKGDGTGDDGPAFRAAFEAARRLNGARCEIAVPTGTYRILPEGNPAENFRCHDWQTGDDCGVVPVRKGENAHSHLVMADLRNVVLRGEGEGSVLAFADATKGGIRVFGCYDVFVENLAMDYCDNPSTQGTIVRVEEEPFALVLKRDAGYPDPDLPRFMNAPSRYFSPVGEGLMYLPGGVARMGAVERLGGDLFRLTPLVQHRNNEVWRTRRAGERICIMARYAEGEGGGPLRFLLSSFCGARNVRAYDSPGQVFTQSQSYATYLVGCRAVGREGSDDVVTSNADGFLGGGLIGPYVAGCEFRGLEDDGINVGTQTGEISSLPKDGFLRQRRDGGGQPAAGGFLSDGVTGLIKMFLRYGPCRGGDAPGTNCASCEQVATRPLPGDAVPKSATKVLTGADRRKFDYNTAQKKGVKRADRLIRIPGTVGAVLKDTSFSRIRGRGIQVHCGNMYVENVRVSDVTGVGISVNALLPWGMCYDIHNVYVKDCVFERLGGFGRFDERAHHARHFRFEESHGCAERLGFDREVHHADGGGGIRPVGGRLSLWLCDGYYEFSVDGRDFAAWIRGGATTARLVSGVRVTVGDETMDAALGLHLAVRRIEASADLDRDLLLFFSHLISPILLC